MTLLPWLLAITLYALGAAQFIGVMESIEESTDRVFESKDWLRALIWPALALSFTFWRVTR